MIMLHRVSIITGVLFFGSISQAIFMIEPSIGYRQETLKTINLAQSETQLKMNAPTYGLKLGFASPIGISFDLAGQTSGKVNSEPTPAEEPEFHTRLHRPKSA